MEHLLERGIERDAVEVTDRPVGIGGGARPCDGVDEAVGSGGFFPPLAAPARSVSRLGVGRLLWRRNPHHLCPYPTSSLLSCETGPTSPLNGWIPRSGYDQGPDLVVGPSQEEIN
jgi:hypothetical protein